MFIEVLDHWDRVGDWAEQWVSLRYITRLLARLDADDDALFLHCALLKAGKPSPLRTPQLKVLVERVGEDRFEAHRASAGDGVAAVARARSSLLRHVERAAEPAL